MLILLFSFWMISITKAFRHPLFQRYSNCSKVYFPLTTSETPLELLFKEKQKQEEQLELYSLYGIDVSPIDRIMDDVIDANDIIHIQGSEIVSIAFYIVIVFISQKNKKQIYKKTKSQSKRKNKLKKTKKFSIPIIVLSILLNFTRNIKPVL